MPGINPFQLAGVDWDKLSLGTTPPSSAFGEYGSIPFITPLVRTVAGTTTYNVWPTSKGVPFPEGVFLLKLRGIMRGAGAGGMTVVAQRVTAAGVATAITDTISVAALGDTATFEESTMDDAQMLISPGETLRIVTANDPLVYVWMEAIKV